MKHKDTCDRRTGSVLGKTGSAPDEDNAWDAMLDAWISSQPIGIYQVDERVAARNPRDTVTKGYPKVTSGQVEDAINRCVYFYTDTMTICVLTLRNGYKVTGESACVSEENYDEALGEKLARKNAVDKVWNLEGYLMRERLYQPYPPPIHPPLVKPPKTETGWLIEWVPENNGLPVWLMSALAGFIPVATSTAAHALRFARKQDAETFVSLNPELCFGTVVTEHAWEAWNKD